MNLASVRNNLGDLYVRQSRSAAAAEAFELAIADLRQLAQTAPDFHEGRDVLAHVLITRGDMRTRAGDFQNARADLDAAIAEFRSLAEQSPGETKYLLGIADATNRLVVLFTKSGRSSDAKNLYEQYVRDTQPKIAARITPNAEPSHELRRKAHEIEANNHIDVASALQPLGFDRLALDSYRSGIETYAELLAEYPEIRLYRLNQAKGRNNLGLLLNQLSLNVEAQEQLQEALAVANALVDAAPLDQYLEPKAVRAGSLGRVLADRADYDSAKQAYAVAIETYSELLKASTDPTFVAQYRRHLALSRHGLARTLLASDDAAYKPEASARSPMITEQSLAELNTAIADWEDLLATLTTPPPQDLAGLAALYSDRGDLHWQSETGKDRKVVSDSEQSAASYSKARELFGQLVERYPTAEHLNQAAWFRANCPDPQFRDADLSLTWAMQATALAPDNGRYHTTSALAHYRKGDWATCLATLQTATELKRAIQPEHETSVDWLLSALAHWKQGHRKEGDQSYQRFRDLTQTHGPGSFDQRRLQYEADELQRQLK